MDTSQVYLHLYTALCNGNPDTIVKWLNQLEDEEMATGIQSLLLTDRCIQQVSESILRQHTLAYALQYFCDHIATALGNDAIAFSTPEYTHPVEHSPLAQSAKYDEIKSRLYTAFIHFCTCAQLQEPAWLKATLSAGKKGLSVSLEADVPLICELDHATRLLLCLGMNHMQRAGGELETKNGVVLSIEY